MPVNTNDRAKTIGFSGAILAYLCWGMMPIYWSLLKGAGSWEVIAHRATWSPLALILLLLCFGRLGELKNTIVHIATVRRHQGFLLVCAAGFAAVNWWINVLAAQVDRVTELGLGMFITPLISIALAVIVFREKMPLMKWLSVIAGLTGLALQAIDYGRIPWIAIGVSVTWAIYGAFKKKIPLDPWMSNTIEGLILMPIALAYIAYLYSSGGNHFMGDSHVCASRYRYRHHDSHVSLCLRSREFAFERFGILPISEPYLHNECRRFYPWRAFQSVSDCSAFIYRRIHRIVLVG